MSDPIKPENLPAQFPSFEFIGEHWLTIAFGIFGILGAIASIVSWNSSRRFKRENEYLFRLADLHIKKDITEKTIEEKKNEEIELKEKIEDLQSIVKREIPLEAKRTVLLDRYDATITVLRDAHRDLLKTKRELEALSTKSDLPPELIKSIESAVEPKYIRKEKISNRKTLLTIISAMAAAGSTLLPYPFSRFVGGALILLSIPVIVSIIRLTIDPIILRKYRNVIFYGLISSILFIIMVPMGIAALINYEPYGFDHMPYLIVFILSAASSMFVGIFSYSKYKTLRCPDSGRNSVNNCAKTSNKAN